MSGDFIFKSNKENTPLNKMKVDVEFYHALNGPSPESTYNTGIAQLLYNYGWLTYRTQQELDSALQRKLSILDPSLSVLGELSRTNVSWTVKRLATALNCLGNFKALSYLVDSAPVIIRSCSKDNVCHARGDQFQLFVEASAIPPANFVWMHRGWESAQSTLLDSRQESCGDKTIRSSIVIQNFKDADEGMYSCLVTNASWGEKSSIKEMKFEVNLSDSNFTIKTAIPAQVSRTCVRKLNGKLALLIGQMEYTEYPLKAPEEDIFIVGKHLESLGFQVIQLFNLNESTFRQAVHCYANHLNDKVYSFFYYAGHGSHWGSNDYCQCLDAKSSVCAQEIIKIFQDKSPAANMVIFDMCRTLDKLNSCDVDYPLKDTQNLAVLFTCSVDRKAFEIQDPSFDDDRLAYSPFREAFVKLISKENKSINFFFNDIACKINRNMQKFKNEFANADMTPNLNLGIYEGSLSDRVVEQRIISIPSSNDKNGGPSIYREDLWKSVILIDCFYLKAHNVLCLKTEKTNCNLAFIPYFNKTQLKQSYPFCKLNSKDDHNLSIYSPVIILSNLENISNDKKFIQVEICLFQVGYDIPDQNCVPSANRFLINIEMPFIKRFLDP